MCIDNVKSRADPLKSEPVSMMNYDDKLCKAVPLIQLLPAVCRRSSDFTILRSTRFTLKIKTSLFELNTNHLTQQSFP